MEVLFRVTIRAVLGPWLDTKLLDLAVNWRQVNDNGEAERQGPSWNRAREATIINGKRSPRKVSAL